MSDVLMVHFRSSQQRKLAHMHAKMALHEYVAILS